MAITKFMQVMFSANERGDEELAKQVAEDIEAAKENGNVETDEIDYHRTDDGDVMVHDKVNNELTLAQKSEDDPESYDLVAVPDDLLESYLHPMEDGVSHEDLEGGETEDFHDHVGPEYFAQGETKVQDLVDEREALEEGEGMEEEAEEKEFSVFSDNAVVQRIFSDQEFCERLFSEVIESEETVKVGDIKVEKIDEDCVLVTSEATGDQAKVELDGDEMEVTELDQKEMSEDDIDEEEEMEYEEEGGEGDEEQYEPMFVVGVDTDNHVIVDAPVYTPEDAQDLVEKLEDAGVQGLNVFECPDEAREHAENLLEQLGVECEEQVCEPEQAEFSDHSIYLTRFYSFDELEELEDRFFSEIEEDCTNYMLKLFSETEDNAPEQEKIEDALESEEEIETDSEVITPVSEDTVVVEDKETGEFTKVVVNDGDMDVSKISEEEAEDLVEDIAVEDEGNDEEEKEEEEKEFSITSYMIRLFSDTEEAEEMSEDVEKALESGEVVETADEIITPISEDEVIVEDKETGEFTKVELEDGELDAEKIDEKEAEELIDEASETEKEEEKNEEESKEKDFSFVNPILSKFFADIMPEAQVQAQAPAPAPVAVPQEQLQAQAQQEVQQAAQEIPAVVEETPSVEAIEDKALAAVEAIHAAAQDAANMIQQAKEAPVPGQEEDLQEAQFSHVDDKAEERFYSETKTLGNWLHNHTR